MMSGLYMTGLIHQSERVDRAILFIKGRARERTEVRTEHRNLNQQNLSLVPNGAPRKSAEGEEHEVDGRIQ
jgi:hypothetical protein